MMWPKDRLAELHKLHVMLCKLSMAKKSSSALDRIAMSITIAQDLRVTDYNTARDSFIDFLIKEAHKEGT